MDKIKQDSFSEILTFIRSELFKEEENVWGVLRVFFSNTGRLLEEALAALDEKSWDDLVRIGHSLKGSASHIQANGISKLGDALEVAALDKAVFSCREIIHQLSIHYSKLKTEYQHAQSATS